MTDPVVWAKRSDLGFVAARGLALGAWFVAVSMAARLIVEAVSIAATNRTVPELPNFSILDWLPEVVSTLIVIGITYVGQRLWVGAELFGADAPAEPADSAVALSRGALLQGTALGVAILLGSSGLATIFEWLYWLAVSPHPIASSFMSRTGVVQAFAEAAAAGVLIAWAYADGRMSNRSGKGANTDASTGSDE